VRRGGFELALFRNSLSLAFLALFVIAFLLHGLGGLRAYNRGRISTANLG
jgi:hypothetical protein